MQDPCPRGRESHLQIAAAALQADHVHEDHSDELQQLVCRLVGILRWTGLQ
jgi:hypothetical protein